MDHTPGPWTSLDDNEVIAPCHEHKDCHKTIVFSVRTMNAMEHLQCSTGTHTAANARLIAAAPDLLMTLKCLLAFDAVRELRDAGPQHARWQSDELSAAIGACEGVIAEAERAK